jgi:hypothetical protein
VPRYVKDSELANWIQLELRLRPFGDTLVYPAAVGHALRFTDVAVFAVAIDSVLGGKTWVDTAPIIDRRLIERFAVPNARDAQLAVAELWEQAELQLGSGSPPTSGVSVVTAGRTVGVRYRPPAEPAARPSPLHQLLGDDEAAVVFAVDRMTAFRVTGRSD